MKALPVGIQSFADLRQKDYLYVDKTEDIHRLITSGKIYFLSRPRRFGKSLLVSTFAELFRGNKSLFEGLYIYDKYDWTQQYPVITIDWSRINHSTAETMEIETSIFIDNMASSHQISLKQIYASSRFDELIMRLYEKTGHQVVVLIDEYDMPILDALSNPEELKLIREFLQSFYKVLKGTDGYLRFIFITGVSKFSKVSVFSGMNSPDDITMNKKYATICGYTQDDYAEIPVSDTDDMRDLMQQQLFNGDISAFQRNMQAMFARIPYQLHIPCDAYYRILNDYTIINEYKND